MEIIPMESFLAALLIEYDQIHLDTFWEKRRLVHDLVPNACVKSDRESFNYAFNGLAPKVFDLGEDSIITAVGLGKDKNHLYNRFLSNIMVDTKIADEFRDVLVGDRVAPAPEAPELDPAVKNIVDYMKQLIVVLEENSHKIRINESEATIEQDTTDISFLGGLHKKSIPGPEKRFNFSVKFTQNILQKTPSKG